MCTRSCFNENILHTTSNSSNLFSFMSKFQILHKFPKTPWEALDVWFKSLRWSKILFDPTKHCQIYEANSYGGLVVGKKYRKSVLKIAFLLLLKCGKIGCYTIEPIKKREA